MLLVNIDQDNSGWANHCLTTDLKSVHTTGSLSSGCIGRDLQVASWEPQRHSRNFTTEPSDRKESKFRCCILSQEEGKFFSISNFRRGVFPAFGNQGSKQALLIIIFLLLFYFSGCKFHTTTGYQFFGSNSNPSGICLSLSPDAIGHFCFRVTHRRTSRSTHKHSDTHFPVLCHSCPQRNFRAPNYFTYIIHAESVCCLRLPNGSKSHMRGRARERKS